jgi:DnaJ-class molecular chaperone
MTEHAGSESGIRYFCCNSCRRWVSTTYAEILTVDAKVRLQANRSNGYSGDFEAIKKKLEHWLDELEGQDPYRVLGLSPADSYEEIKSRYRQLALERHPDRGGSQEKMQELNLAYGRISSHRELTARDSPRPSRVPRTVRRTGTK